MHKIILIDGLKFLTRMTAAQGLYSEILKCCPYLQFNNSIRLNEEVIVVSRYLKDSLCVEEFKAICLHEEGHFVNNHARRTSVSGIGAKIKNNVNMLIEPIYELEADAYAASIVGANCMSSALTNLLDIVFGHPELIEGALLNGYTAIDFDNKMKIEKTNAGLRMKYRHDALLRM